MRAPLICVSCPLLESLEGRHLYSASPSATLLSASALPVAPAITAAKVSILGPSAVEGTYKGDSDGSDGVIYEIKLVVTPSSARLTFEGLGTYSASLTTNQFKAIREGKFDVKFTGIGGAKGSVTFTGTVKDSGLKITGDYVNSASRTGTFIVKK